MRPQLVRTTHDLEVATATYSLLASARRRLDRSRAQLTALSRAIADYAASTTRHETFSVVEDALVGPDGRWPLRIALSTPPDYLDWSHAVGEIVHNARTPLDHLVHGLLTRGGAVDTWTPTFPILALPAGSATPSEDQFRDRFKWIQSLAPAVSAVLFGLQPHNGQPGRWLLELDRLSAIDKHRLPLLATVATRLEHARYTFTGASSAFSWIEQFPFVDSVVVGSSGERLSSAPKLKVGLTVKLAEAGEQRELLPTLDACISAANEAVERLSSQLPS